MLFTANKKLLFKYTETRILKTIYNNPFVLTYPWYLERGYIDGLMQDRRTSIVNALELLQSYTIPSIWWSLHHESKVPWALLVPGAFGTVFHV